MEPEGLSAYLGECCDLGTGLVAADVVNSHAGLGAQAQIDYLGNSLEGAVACLEVDIGGPVVGKVLRVSAAGASRHRRGVVHGGGHGGVERVASHDLMHVCRGDIARLDQGVDLVDGQLGAAEAHQLLRRGELHEKQ
jgi:hypothetical protein